MTKIKLFNRTEEIFTLLPKQYAEIILNAIIAKSAKNGELFKEVEMFLTTEEFIEFKKNFNNNKSEEITPKKVMSRGTETLVSETKTKREHQHEKDKSEFTY